MRPGPVGREPQDDVSGSVNEPSGEGDELGAVGSGDSKPVLGGGVAEVDGPADEVVGQDSAGEPRSVGGEVSRGDMGEAGTLFEVPDSELNNGVMTMFTVDHSGGLVAIGDKHVVAPIREQGGLLFG